MNRIEAIEVKSVLTPQTGRHRIPYDYTINPYRGCLFGCSYCYASKFVHDDDDKKAEWGFWVEYKKNAVDALLRESYKITGKSVFFSSATDPYQPVERRLGLTRALLEVLLFAFPSHLHMQSRSPMIARDIDLLLRFGSSLSVGLSIPTDSEVVRKVFEPRAPSIPRRLQTARALKSAGIRVTASVAPLLPCTPDRLARLLAPCVNKAWVGTINFYEKEEKLLRLYRERGWERFLSPTHAAEVEEALKRRGLRQSSPP